MLSQFFVSILVLTTIFGTHFGIAKEKEAVSLARLRAAQQTFLEKKTKSEDALEKPPQDAPFELVQYPTEIGEMWAYLSSEKVKNQEAKPPAKKPAIVWLTGGVPPAGPGSYLWEETQLENEQSARIYRLNGITMMFPTVRGTIKENPGHHEWFYGEVDDVVSACEFLAQRPEVDPERIYVGGHSGGGTLALLVAASTTKVAGVISFGPSEKDYESKDRPYRLSEREQQLRWPIKHLHRIKVPTYVVGGEYQDQPSLQSLSKANENPLVKFYSIEGADHFNVLHPVNVLFADAILKSKDGVLKIPKKDLQQCYLKHARRLRETGDLEILADYRSRGMDLDRHRTVSFYYLAAEKRDFTEKFRAAAEAAEFEYREAKKFENSGGDYYALVLTKKLNLQDLRELFSATKEAAELGDEFELQYDDWSAE